MIRINLLGGERQVKKTRGRVRYRPARHGCLQRAARADGRRYRVLVLLAETAVGAARCRDRCPRNRKQTRLQSIIREVAAFETSAAPCSNAWRSSSSFAAARAFRCSCSITVSKSLPDMLWLTDLEQKGNDVTIEGQSTTLIALSDFVGNLGTSSLLVKPIEIVNSQVESVARPGQKAAKVDLIKFTVKAQLVPPKNAPPPLPARGRGAARGATPSPAGRGAAGALKRPRGCPIRRNGYELQSQQDAVVRPAGAFAALRWRRRRLLELVREAGAGQLSTSGRPSWRRSAPTSTEVWRRRAPSGSSARGRGARGTARSAAAGAAR